MSLLEELVDVLGDNATLDLLEAHGGTRIFVPKRPVTKHQLTRLLGKDACGKLVEHFGSCELSLPIAREWRYGVLSKRGLTTREMALRLHCTEKSVYALKRGERRTPGQLQLL